MEKNPGKDTRLSVLMKWNQHTVWRRWSRHTAYLIKLLVLPTSWCTSILTAFVIASLLWKCDWLSYIFFCGCGSFCGLCYYTVSLKRHSHPELGDSLKWQYGSIYLLCNLPHFILKWWEILTLTLTNQPWGAHHNTSILLQHHRKSNLILFFLNWLVFLFTVIKIKMSLMHLV